MSTAAAPAPSDTPATPRRTLSLYDITESILTLNEIVDSPPGEGEADEVAITALLDEFIGKLLPEKVDNYCRMIASLKGAAEIKRAEAKRLTERARIHESTVARMVDRLKEAMIAVDRRKVDTDLFRVMVQASPPSVVITDEAAIPDTFQVATVKVDKAKLKQALKRGDDVAGAELAEGNTHLRIK